MLSPDDARRLIAACRAWFDGAGHPDGARLCTAVLDGTVLDGWDEDVAEPPAGDWASLLHAGPRQLLAAALAHPVPTEALATALAARLVNAVRADDLTAGAAVLHAALVAGLGHRPTVERAVDLLVLAARPGGGFPRTWRGGGPADAPTTVRCVRVLAEVAVPVAGRLTPPMAGPLAGADPN